MKYRYLEFLEAVPSDFEGMDSSCFGTTEVDKGKLRAIWVSPYALPIPFENGTQPFRLRFKVLQPIENLSDVLSLDNTVMKDRAYEADGTESGLELVIEDKLSLSTPSSFAPAKIAVAAVPNPFRNELRLYVTVPEDDWMEVSVFDVNGKLVAAWSGETIERKSEIFFNDTNAWGKGVFTYRVRTAQNTATGKIAKQ